MMLRCHAASPITFERPELNIVLIRSWIDPVLQKRLPRSPAQLHGLTFYVEDPEQAEVRLDGRLIETLTRNGPIEPGVHR